MQCSAMFRFVNYSDSARNVGDVRKHVAPMMIFHWSLYSQMYGAWVYYTLLRMRHIPLNQVL